MKWNLDITKGQARDLKGPAKYVRYNEVYIEVLFCVILLLLEPGEEYRFLYRARTSLCVHTRFVPLFKKKSQIDLIYLYHVVFVGMPAYITERIRQLYQVREGQLKPFTWCDYPNFNLNDIFTRLKIRNREKTRGTLTDDEITNMTAIFRPHPKCQEPRIVLIEGDPGMGKTTYSQKLAYDWANKQYEWDESFPVIEVLLLLRCNDIKTSIEEAIDDQKAYSGTLTRLNSP